MPLRLLLFNKVLNVFFLYVLGLQRYQDQTFCALTIPKRCRLLYKEENLPILSDQITPCFTPGTMIATPKGERAVETLQTGDAVITRDNGIQEIRWTGARKITWAKLSRAAYLQPILIRQGSLGNNLPERDMMVSPNHRVLVTSDKTALPFDDREVLVSAKHLTGVQGVGVMPSTGLTYIHLLFDHHEVVLSDGIWTESFQPSAESLAGIGNAQRTEIQEIFPQLATPEGVNSFLPARRILHQSGILAFSK